MGIDLQLKNMESLFPSGFSEGQKAQAKTLLRRYLPLGPWSKVEVAL